MGSRPRACLLEGRESAILAAKPECKLNYTLFQKDAAMTSNSAPHMLEIDTPVSKFLMSMLDTKSVLKLYRVSLASGLRPPLVTWLRYCHADNHGFRILSQHQVPEETAIALCTPSGLPKIDSPLRLNQHKEVYETFVALLFRGQFQALNVLFETAPSFSGEHIPRYLYDFITCEVKEGRATPEQVKWICTYILALPGMGLNTMEELLNTYTRWELQQPTNNSFHTTLEKILRLAEPRSLSPPVKLLSLIINNYHHYRKCYRVIVEHKEKFKLLGEGDSQFYFLTLYYGILNGEPDTVTILCALAETNFNSICRACRHLVVTGLEGITLNGRGAHRMLWGVLKRTPRHPNPEKYFQFAAAEIRYLGRPGVISSWAANFLKVEARGAAATEYNGPSALPAYKEWLAEVFDLTPRERHNADRLLILNGGHEGLQWLVKTPLPVSERLFAPGTETYRVALACGLKENDPELIKEVLRRSGGPVPGKELVIVLLSVGCERKVLVSESAKLLAGSSGDLPHSELEKVCWVLKSVSALEAFQELFNLPSALMERVARQAAIVNMANDPREMERVGVLWVERGAPPLPKAKRQALFSAYRRRRRGAVTNRDLKALIALGFEPDDVPFHEVAALLFEDWTLLPLLEGQKFPPPTRAELKDLARSVTDCLLQAARPVPSSSEFAKNLLRLAGLIGERRRFDRGVFLEYVDLELEFKRYPEYQDAFQRALAKLPGTAD